MKNIRGFLDVLTLLSLSLFFSSAAYAHTAKDPQRDLRVTQSRARENTAFGAVVGNVVNTPTNDYPFVPLEFDLSTRDDQQPSAGQPQPRRRPQPQPNDENVVIYEDPNFEGRSRSFGIGGHRLFNAEDFNDVASSIKVPAGLVAVVYEHADERGGFGIWVDFLKTRLRYRVLISTTRYRIWKFSLVSVPTSSGREIETKMKGSSRVIGKVFHGPGFLTIQFPWSPRRSRRMFQWRRVLRSRHSSRGRSSRSRSRQNRNRSTNLPSAACVQ